MIEDHIFMSTAVLQTTKNALFGRRFQMNLKLIICRPICITVDVTLYSRP